MRPTLLVSILKEVLALVEGKQNCIGGNIGEHSYLVLSQSDNRAHIIMVHYLQ